MWDRCLSQEVVNLEQLMEPGIEVQLRAENGDIVAAVSDPEMVLSRAAREKFSGTRLL